MKKIVITIDGQNEAVMTDSVITAVNKFFEGENAPANITVKAYQDKEIKTFDFMNAQKGVANG